MEKQNIPVHVVAFHDPANSSAGVSSNVRVHPQSVLVDDKGKQKHFAVDATYEMTLGGNNNNKTSSSSSSSSSAMTHLFSSTLETRLMDAGAATAPTNHIGMLIAGDEVCGAKLFLGTAENPGLLLRSVQEVISMVNDASGASVGTGLKKAEFCVVVVDAKTGTARDALASSSTSASPTKDLGPAVYVPDLEKTVLGCHASSSSSASFRTPTYVDASVGYAQAACLIFAARSVIEGDDEDDEDDEAQAADGSTPSSYVVAEFLLYHQQQHEQQQKEPQTPPPSHHHRVPGSALSVSRLQIVWVKDHVDDLRLVVGDSGSGEEKKCDALRAILDNGNMLGSSSSSSSSSRGSRWMTSVVAAVVASDDVCDIDDARRTLEAVAPIRNGFALVKTNASASSSSSSSAYASASLLKRLETDLSKASAATSAARLRELRAAVGFVRGVRCRCVDMLIPPHEEEIETTEGKQQDGSASEKEEERGGNENKKATATTEEPKQPSGRGGSSVRQQAAEWKQQQPDDASPPPSKEQSPANNNNKDSTPPRQQQQEATTPAPTSPSAADVANMSPARTRMELLTSQHEMRQLKTNYAEKCALLSHTEAALRDANDAVNRQKRTINGLNVQVESLRVNEVMLKKQVEELVAQEEGMRSLASVSAKKNPVLVSKDEQIAALKRQLEAAQQHQLDTSRLHQQQHDASNNNKGGDWEGYHRHVQQELAAERDTYKVQVELLQDRLLELETENRRLKHLVSSGGTTDTAAAAPEQQPARQSTSAVPRLYGVSPLLRRSQQQQQQSEEAPARTATTTTTSAGRRTTPLKPKTVTTPRGTQKVPTTAATTTATTTSSSLRRQQTPPNTATATTTSATTTQRASPYARATTTPGGGGTRGGTPPLRTASPIYTRSPSQAQSQSQQPRRESPSQARRALNSATFASATSASANRAAGRTHPITAIKQQHAPLSRLASPTHIQQMQQRLGRHDSPLNNNSKTTTTTSVRIPPGSGGGTNAGATRTSAGGVPLTSVHASAYRPPPTLYATGNTSSTAYRRTTTAGSGSGSGPAFSGPLSRPTRVSPVRSGAAFKSPHYSNTTYRPTRMVRHNEWESAEDAVMR